MKKHRFWKNEKVPLSWVSLALGLLFVGVFLIAGSRLTAKAGSDMRRLDAEVSSQLVGKNAYLPLISKSDITRMRPYSSSSYWNTAIGANPQYDSHSAEMIATIGLAGAGQILSDPSQYSFPVYFADSTTPRWNVPCLEYNCMILSPRGSTTVPVLQNVPIPAAARPSSGSDAQMIIIDLATLTEYDFWQVESSANGWTVSNATVYNISWDGTPDKYNSRGAGVPYYAGLVRPWEILQGHIDHALAFGYPETARDRCVFPATKTDGSSGLPYAIPEGAHLQLDPSLTESDFNQMGLDRAGKIIARALQTYGMILIDSSGQAKIYVEDLANNPYATIQWSDPALKLDNKTISTIPHTYFRVLKLPPAYWNPGQGSGFNGDCYDIP